MVRSHPTSRLSCIDLLSLAETARSVVTVRSQSATTVPSVKGMMNVLTMLYRSVVGLIRPRGHALVAPGQKMMKNTPRGAGVAPRQSIEALLGLMALCGQVSPPSP